MKKIILACIIIGMSFPAQAAFTKADRGTSGAKFLKIPAGARAIGMGGAYTGLADDSLAVLWNPAGLTRLARPEITAMRNLWLSSMRNDTVIFAMPFGMNGQAVALSVQSLSMDDIDLYTNGALLKTFKPRDTAVGISYARMIGPLRMGVNLKGIHQKFVDKTLKGMSIDAGCMLRSMQDTSGIGLSVYNMGPKIDGDPLPLGIRAGVMHRFLSKKNLIVTFDGYMPRDDVASLHAGTEYTMQLTEEFSTSVRSGYKTKNINDLDIIAGLSAGLGLKWHEVNVDYVFVPYGDLGNTHRVGIGYAFGGKYQLRYKGEKDYQKSMRMYEEGLLLDASITLRTYENNPGIHHQAAKFALLVNNEIEQSLNPEKMFTQAYLFYKLKKYNQARELLTETLRIDPNHTKAKKLNMRVQNYLLAISHEENEQKELKQALENDRIIKTLMWSAYRQYKQEIYHEAKLSYEKILEYDPHNISAKQGILTVKTEIDRQNMKQNRERTAMKEREKKRDEKLAEVIYQQGLREYLEGNVKKAAKLWENALVYNPEHQQAKNALLDANME